MREMGRQPLVLLAESDAVVAMDLGDALEGAGYRVLGPFATTAEALSCLTRETPALAIVDTMLRDGPCAALAHALRRCRVPFLVHSSLERDDPDAAGFQDAPWLRKPALPWDVVILLDEVAISDPAREAPAQTAPPAPVRPPPIGRDQRNPFVRKLEGFAPLSVADRAMLERISANPRTVAPQTDLVREGDKPDGVFLILDGIACRQKMRATGVRQILAYLLPGDACDIDVAMLETMDHTLTTLSACKVVRIAPETVAALMRHHPQIARALRITTLVDEATLREWLVNVGCRSALERVAHLFCELLVRLRAVGFGTEDSYDLPITQTDLADTTGLSSVHMNRTLQELRRQGLIELRSGRLKIVNLPHLKALAEFKANYLHLGDRVAA